MVDRRGCWRQRVGELDRIVAEVERVVVDTFHPEVRAVELPGGVEIRRRQGDVRQRAHRTRRDRREADLLGAWQQLHADAVRIGEEREPPLTAAGDARYRELAVPEPDQPGVV